MIRRGAAPALLGGPRRHSLAALLVIAGLTAHAPAPAQLFWQVPSLSAPVLSGAEPDLGVNLPGATGEELSAGLVWQLRAALNVAALQCDFEPALLAVSTYNALLAQHKGEFTQAFARVGGYFTRRNGAAAGQRLFDQYGTRVYSSFSTVQAQRGFCQVATQIGRDALFVPRGKLAGFAAERLGIIKKALTPLTDVGFADPAAHYAPPLPPLEARCWKKGALQKACAGRWPPPAGGSAVAPSR